MIHTISPRLILLGILGVLVFFYVPEDLAAQQKPDTTELPDVARPAYSGDGPTICIDEAHNNLHRLDTGFSPFAAFLRKDGYRVISSEKRFEEGMPPECDLLVIANALNESNIQNWVVPTPSAFTDDEIESLSEWVRDGGSLFLIADHMPFPGAAGDLAGAFGFRFNNGFAMKQVQTWPPGMFRKDDGTLASGPVTDGVDSVATYTGQAFQIPDSAHSILTFGDDHYTLMPDTAWRFSGNTPQHSVEGWSQGAVMPFGKGRLAVFGEAAMFTGQVAGNRRSGIIDPGAPDNARLLLSVIHWLDPDPDPSRGIDRLYRQFSQAYQTRDVELVTSLYAEDARYLPSDAKQAILAGRSEIRDLFASFLAAPSGRDRDLDIQFRILARQISDSLAYDTGYYLIRSKAGDAPDFPEGGTVGKFVTVMGLQDDGSWKFLVDGFSPAPNEAFCADSTAHNPAH